MVMEKTKLPDGWRWVKLGGEKGVADIVNGSTPSTDNPDYWGGEVLWATPSDLGSLNSMYIGDTERKITLAGLKSCSAKLLPPGSVLLTSRAPVGNIAIAKKEICTNQGFKSFIPKKNIYSLYLYFAIRKIIPEIQKQSHGNTFIEITKALIQHFEIPLPPTLNEQLTIANEFERKMAEVEKMRQAVLRQKEAAEDLKGKILTKAFPYKNGDKLPEGWKWAKCQDIIDVRDGTHDTPAYIEKGIPLVTSKNLKNGQIDFETAKFISTDDHKLIEQRSKVDDGDILFAMIGTIGNPVIVKKDRDFSIKNIALFKFKNSPINTKFFYHLLSSQIINDQLLKITQGGIQSFVSLQFLRAISIPLPYSSVVQKQIAEKLDKDMKEIEKVAQAVDIQLETIQALPAAILREVFDFQEANA